jgi:hypothetical protein
MAASSCITTTPDQPASPVDYIVCPPWCVVGARRHAEELEGYEGVCVHQSADASFVSLNSSRPAEVGLTEITLPDGAVELAGFVAIEDTQIPVEDAERLGRHLLRLVATYHAAREVDPA